MIPYLLSAFFIRKSSCGHSKTKTIFTFVRDEKKHYAHRAAWCVERTVKKQEICAFCGERGGYYSLVTTQLYSSWGAP